MMNTENQISKQTTLFGFIGEHAGVSRLCALCNKKFKQDQVDAMMIPMNIREDDFYFTLSNMKKSHVNGAIISNEYSTKAVELLDTSSGLVQKSGMCDIVFKEGETLRGDTFVTRVLLEKLKDLGVSRIAMIGTSPHAKAFALMACGFCVSYFYDDLELLMKFTQEMELSQPDINRLAHGMSVDLNNYDAVLDFSDLETLEMVKSLPAYSFDMKNTKEYSALKTRANQLGTKYIGYDDMIEELSAHAYRLITKGR